MRIKRENDIMNSFFFNSRGQSLLQYTMILGITATVFIVMAPMLRRLSQGFIKVAADQIGTQQNGEQSFDLRGGYLKNSVQWRGGFTDKKTQEFAGNITYSYNDETQTWSKSEVDMGFSSK